MDDKRESSQSAPDQLAFLSDDSSFGIEIEIGALLGVRDVPKKRREIEVPQPKTRKYYWSKRLADFTGQEESYLELTPFGYPADLELMSHAVSTRAWRSDARIEELKKKCTEKPSFRQKQQKHFSERLHVADPPHDGMMTVGDIDPQYFEIVRKKPEKLNISDYIQTVRQSLKTRIIIGYREDDIMRIDENLATEQRILNIIRENFHKYMNIFEEFLYRDHTTAMQVLSDSDTAAREAYDKYEEYKLVMKDVNSLKSSIFVAEEKWTSMKIYQRFLFALSPASWRATQSSRRASVHFDGVDDEPDDEKSIFGIYRKNQDEKNVTLDGIIRTFMMETKGETTPELYFTKPDQLLDVIHFLEMQILDALLHREHLEIALKNLKDGMEGVEKSLKEEVKYMQDAIDKLKTSIYWEETREAYLKDRASNLLKTQFKQLITSKDVLKLHVAVEDLYETRVAPNDADLSMLEMMTEVEKKYRAEQFSLDLLPAENIVLLKNIFYVEEFRMMKLAERAARDVVEMERLAKRLSRAVAPPFVKPAGKPLMQRSPVKDYVVDEYVEPKRDLTYYEEDYLEFFTDYCRNVDDPKEYLHGDELSFTTTTSTIGREPKKHRFRGSMSVATQST
ncbi:hypothetical protein JTB14_001321 [Gonioctena quinquepunctata]|nr:hypothetical protein JTB14_001321 [Gonioctena quinquepunctata]